MNSLINDLIPHNKTGKPVDLEESITLPGKEDAIDAYKRACKRLLNVNIWHKLSGFASADFLLKNEEGIASHGLAEVGDYFQIDIPGPGPASGDGYDWVKVEAIEKRSDPASEEESMGMMLRPSENPNKKGSDTSHFFTTEATSTFIIHRKENVVSVSYHGRNEVLNTATEKLTDKIRNSIIGMVAMLGISELQWNSLIKSFLEREV